MSGGSQIRHQLLALALLPASLVALVLMLFYLNNRLEGLEESMRERVHATADSLASASEFALFSGDAGYLRNLGVTESLQTGGDFEAGVLRDVDGHVLIEWGAPESWRVPLDVLPTAEGAQLIDDGRRLVYHHPVTTSPGSVDSPLALEGETSAPPGPRRLLGWLTLQYSRAAITTQRNSIILNSILITLGGILIGGLLAFRNMMGQWKASGALEMEMLKETEEEVHFNVTRCKYSEMYREMGLGHIGHLLSCNRDGTFCTGFNPKIKLERTQTIMSGASHCDFRYRYEDDGDAPD